MAFGNNARIRVNYSSSEYHGKTGRVVRYDGADVVVQLDALGRREITLPEAMLEASSSVSPYVYDDRPHVHPVACQKQIGQCAIPMEDPGEDAEPDSSSSMSSSSAGA